MSAQILRLRGRAVKINPPHLTDERSRAVRLGSSPAELRHREGLSVSSSAQTRRQPAKADGMESRTLRARRQPLVDEPDTMGVYGILLKRAIISQVGPRANLPRTRFYRSNLGDDAAGRSTAPNNYVLTSRRCDAAGQCFCRCGSMTPGLPGREQPSALASAVDAFSYNATARLDIYSKRHRQGQGRQLAPAPKDPQPDHAPLRSQVRVLTAMDPVGQEDRAGTSARSRP